MMKLASITRSRGAANEIALGLLESAFGCSPLLPGSPDTAQCSLRPKFISKYQHPASRFSSVRRPEQQRAAEMYSRAAEAAGRVYSGRRYTARAGGAVIISLFALVSGGSRAAERQEQLRAAERRLLWTTQWCAEYGAYMLHSTG
ncbi:hypothetical protein QAD02_011250 [Eretmocerus hayati]|uniref:Uncharacterized protein n=1 Tax=Eretmocerus hayati TaxID=131215 RepID=A0ACC2NWL9_9HYME|nr:hypothetical protein QAD02_011250 [Eretmocerus hayati]